MSIRTQDTAAALLSAGDEAPFSVTPENAPTAHERRSAEPKSAARIDPRTGRLTRLAPTVSRLVSATAYLRSYDGGIYANLDIDLTLDYMLRRFVRPLSRHVDIANATLLDCASGFGWLSFAYLLAGGGRAILVDLDAERLAAARRIATALGIAGRCEFRQSRLQDLDLGPDGVDIVASIETLEHVGRENVPACIAAIVGMAKQAVLVMTPNFLFPVVAHDTHLPLAHWLPAPLRRRYAAAAGRAAMDLGNDFLRPWDLLPLTRKYRPVGSYQTFASRAEFDAFFPHYMPYGRDERQRSRARPLALHRLLQVALSTLLGSWSFALAPNLASLWIRRK